MPVEEDGTEIIKGNHSVPPGVAVEELDGGKKKLSDQCPDAVRELLEKHSAVDLYDKMVKAIVDAGNTRSSFGNWKSAEFNSILGCFREDFAEHGIKLAFCKRKSGSGKFAWIEFIDTELAPDYVPQFDTANLSGQSIFTCYTTLKFPNGVAVEELGRYGNARKKLKEVCPAEVQTMLEKKGLMDEYNRLVDACASEGTGAWYKQGWNIEKLKGVKEEFEPIFEGKGVALFLSLKKEYISHGQYGGHYEYFRWLEFVDREVQPNYFPQRDAETKNECVIS